MRLGCRSEYVLIAVAAFVCLGAAVALFALPHRATGPSTAPNVCCLPDGTELTLETTTFGARHVFYPRSPVPGWVARRMPRSWQPPGPVETRTSADAAVLWLTRRNGSTGQYMELDPQFPLIALDRHGCRYYASGGGGTRFGAAARGKWTPDAVCYTTLSAFPRRDASFRVAICDRNENPLHEFPVATAAGGGSFPVWVPQPLPATARAGDLTVTLTAVRIAMEPCGCCRPYPHDRPRLRPSFRIAWRGRPTREWRPAETTARDATGNTAPEDCCHLCPYEPAWRLSTRLKHFGRTKLPDCTVEFTIRPPAPKAKP